MAHVCQRKPKKLLLALQRCRAKLSLLEEQHVPPRMRALGRRRLDSSLRLPIWLTTSDVRSNRLRLPCGTTPFANVASLYNFCPKMYTKRNMQTCIRNVCSKCNANQLPIIKRYRKLQTRRGCETIQSDVYIGTRKQKFYRLVHKGGSYSWRKKLFSFEWPAESIRRN